MPRSFGEGAARTREDIYEAVTSRGGTVAQITQRAGYSKQVMWLRLRELHQAERIYIERWVNWHTPAWAQQVPGGVIEPDARRPLRQTASERTRRYREKHKALVTAKRRKQDGVCADVGMWAGLMK